MWWCLITKLCPTLGDPIDYSPPGSSVHGISQARILEWVAISSSTGSSQFRGRTCVSCIARRILYHSATRAALCVEGQIFPSGFSFGSSIVSFVILTKAIIIPTLKCIYKYSVCNWHETQTALPSPGAQFLLLSPFNVSDDYKQNYQKQ